jgi:hypothetical protein
MNFTKTQIILHLLWFGFAFLHIYVGFLSSFHLLTFAGLIYVIFMIRSILSTIKENNKFAEYMSFAKPYLQKLNKKIEEFKNINNFSEGKSILIKNLDIFSVEFWWLDGNFLLSLKTLEWYEDQVFQENGDYSTEAGIYSNIVKKNKNQFPLFERKIDIGRIKYYKIDGQKRYETKISGGGSSIGGAIVGGAIAGVAGAVIGSRKNIESKEVEHDERKIILVYLKDEKIVKESFVYSDFIHVFEKLIPEKNYELLLLEGINGNQG